MLLHRLCYWHLSCPFVGCKCPCLLTESVISTIVSRYRPIYRSPGWQDSGGELPCIMTISEDDVVSTSLRHGKRRRRPNASNLVQFHCTYFVQKSYISGKLNNNHNTKHNKSICEIWSVKNVYSFSMS